jgi:hypothetical protein
MSLFSTEVLLGLLVILPVTAYVIAVKKTKREAGVLGNIKKSIEQQTSQSKSLMETIESAEKRAEGLQSLIKTDYGHTARNHPDRPIDQLLPG